MHAPSPHKRLQVLGLGVSVHAALACCFTAAVLVAVLAIVRLLGAILGVVPNSIKMATVVGMGLLLSFIGLQTAKVVIADKETMVGLGDLTSLEPLLAVGCLFCKLVLLHVLLHLCCHATCKVDRVLQRDNVAVIAALYTAMYTLIPPTPPLAFGCTPPHRPLHSWAAWLWSLRCTTSTFRGRS